MIDIKKYFMKKLLILPFLILTFVCSAQTTYKITHISNSIKLSNGKTVETKQPYKPKYDISFILYNNKCILSFNDYNYSYDKKVIEQSDEKLYFHYRKEVLIFNKSKMKVSIWDGELQHDGSKVFTHFTLKDN